MNLPSALSGVDLTSYPQELMRLRTVSSINLRRRPSTPDYPKPKPSQSLIQLQDNYLPEITPDYVQACFSSGNNSSISSAAIETMSLIESHPKLALQITKNETILSSIISSLQNVQSINEFEALSRLFLVLFEKGSSEIADSDLFFTIRDFLPVFPFCLLQFYSLVASSSAYARNAMICLGILDDIVDICADAPDSSLAAAAAATILGISSTSGIDIVGNIDSFARIIELLKHTEDDVIKSVIQALVNIARQAPRIIPLLYDHSVHVFLAKKIEESEFSKLCLSLCVEMANCEVYRLKQLIDCGLIQKVINLVGAGASEDVFLILANCVESSVDAILPMLDEKFITAASTILNDCPYPVFTQVTYFSATLLLMVPETKVGLLLSRGVMKGIAEMLSSGINHIVVRVLDCISRILCLANSDPSLHYLVSILFLEDVQEGLSSLAEGENGAIAAQASTILGSLKEFIGSAD